MSRQFVLALFALGLVMLSACSQDQSTAPAAIAAPSAASPDLLGTLGSTVGSTVDAVTNTVGAVTNTLGLTSVNGLQRSTPLSAPITVSKTIGYFGGTLSIPAAGVTVIVPIGALDRPTEITMTARAGSLVAYDFAPHGIVFRKPLVFKQSLRGTNATLLSAPFLKLGYYEDPSLLGKTTGVVTELVGGLFTALDWTFTAPIKHFSGYMVSCGRDSE
jgi:hypothetical protein